MLTRFALLIAGCLLLPAGLFAQDARTDEVAAKQKDKAAVAKPYAPTRFERIMTGLEESLSSPPNGFYPAFGGVYAGGGFSPGVGYRRFFAREAVWDVHGLYSLKNYKLIETGIRSPWNGAGRYTFGVKGGWLDAPQVGYYGLGMQEEPRRAHVHLEQGYAAFTTSLRPNRWTRLQGEVGYDDYKTSRGRGRAPSIETIYDPTTAPGLGASPSFVRLEGTAAIDWRTSPLYSARGGYYGVTLASYSDPDDNFSFKRLDGELIQHIPLLYNNWVISLRGRVQTTLDDDDVVPYFLLPRLGGSTSLRAYRTGRFRDRHSILTSAEFRWLPNRLGLDMAVFYDAGKVAGDRGDLDFNGLRSDWGFGARFHVPTATLLRIEAAKGSEGWRLIFATTAPF